MDRKHTAPATGKPKISQSVLAFAGDFIGMGKTLKERQIRLTAASCAWNIASNIPEFHKKNLDHYMREYKRYNLRTNEADLVAIRKDMETLIAKKMEMFPDDRRQIVNTNISVVGGKDYVEIAAARLQ
jgi:hypothetical protein